MPYGTQAYGGGTGAQVSAAVGASATDAANGTDAASRLLLQARVATDAAGGADSVHQPFQGRAASDAASGTDAAARVVAELRVATDAAGGTDTAVGVALKPLYVTAARSRSGSTAPARVRSLTASGSRARAGYVFPQGPIVGLVRWRFDDPWPNSSYTFEVNPFSGGSASAKRNVTPVPTTAANGTGLVFEGDDDILSSEFVVRVRSKAQYDALRTWMDKRHPIFLTDDLGRRSVVVLNKLTAKRKWSVQHAYRQELTVAYKILQQVDV